MNSGNRFAAFMLISVLFLFAATLPFSLSLRASGADEDWQGPTTVRGGSILYGASSSADTLIKIEPSTGTGTQIGSLGIDIGNQGIDFHPDGQLYGLFWNNALPAYGLYTISLENGKATLVGLLNLGLSMEGTDLAINGEGDIFGIVGNQVIAIDRLTGQGTIIYHLPSDFDVPGLEFASDGTLCAAGKTANGFKLITILVDPPNYSYKEIGDLDRSYVGLSFDSSGILYASAESHLYIIDTVTAQQTLKGPFGFDAVAGIDFSPEFKLEIIYSLPYARPGYLTWWKIELVNDGDLDVYIDRVRLDVYNDGTLFTSKYLWAGNLSIPAGQSNYYWINLMVGSQVQLGTYLVETVAEYQGDVKATGSFEIEVVK